MLIKCTLFIIMDVDSLSVREEHDFNVFSKAIRDAYRRFEPLIWATQPKSISDARMTLAGRKFNVEIKSRYQSKSYGTLPITVKKYCNLKDNTFPDETLLYAVILNDEELYIFDLKKIDMNKVIIRNWDINEVEFPAQGEPVKKKQPAMFIPFSEAKAVLQLKK